MNRSADILIDKLDAFIRRYYRNQLIRGSLYATGILLAAFLSVVLLEYFGEFGTGVRATLFFGFLGLTLFVLGKYIAIPLLKLNKIGDVISYEQAAGIIGGHFSNVQDKLLNILQLQNMRALSGSEELLLAGIRQKTEELRPVPFAAAVDINENRRYFRYVLPLILVSVTIALIWPQVYRKSAKRLVNYDTYFEKEMPFTFDLSNKKLEVLQASDFKLEVNVRGESLPNEVFIHVNGIEYRLEKDSRTRYHYTFPNVQSGVDFQLGAAGFLSKPYSLTVLPRPVLLKFSLQLQYPAYLNRENELLQNTGDLQVPQGTKVTWTFHTRNTDDITLRFSDTTVQPGATSSNEFGYSRRFTQSSRYTILPRNKQVMMGADSVGYAVQVIPDQFPIISAGVETDSLDPRQIYFSGQIKDDYGFSSLTFNYRKLTTDTLGKEIEKSGTIPLAVQKGQISQPFFHYFNAAETPDGLPLQPGDKIEYYFEVKDNDGVNGAKSARTRMMEYAAPTRDQLRENTGKQNEAIRRDLEESVKKSRELQREINALAKKLADKKQAGYEEKKKLEELLKQQQSLQNKIEQIQRQNEAKNKQQEEFSNTDESILEKQQELEKLFENVMTPEMKKLFDELNRMLDKLDKNQVMEKLEEMKLSNKDIEKELDRNLELFRELEVQQKMQDAIDKLDELKERQDALREQTENKKPDDKKEKSTDSDDEKKSGEQKDEKKTDNKTLEQKQDALSKEFEKLKEDLKELEEKNKALEEPNQLPDTKARQEEISKAMENSSQQLNKNNRKNAAGSQKDASDKMEEMRDQLEQAMMEEEEEQAGENAQALRQILENLLQLSFSQEELMKDLSATRIDNPKYVDIPKTQKKLHDDSKIIEDSLFALSKRAPQISAMVNRGISSINLNMDKTIKALAERNSGEGSMRMQSTMKSVNDLALLLNESLEQMQNQMKQQMQNKAQKAGKCKKPGKGSGNNPDSQGKPAANLRKLQEQLNKQLQEMKDALEKGGQKPGEKPGEKPGSMGRKGPQGQSLMPGSEQFAKMAAQQEALRRQMQELMDKMKNQGRQPGGNLTDLMEQTEKDLVNKRLTNETMRRQQEILTRLLESEKAEREREQDEQRKSNEAKNENLSNPEQFLEYKRLKEKEMELLNTVPPGFTPYYKEKVNAYFNNLNSR